MNICLVSTCYPPEESGGIGTYISNLSRGLTDLGHTVFVVAWTLKDEKFEEIEGISIYRLKMRYIPKLEKYIPGLAWSIFIFNKIAELDRRYGIDIIEFPNWENPGFWHSLKKRKIPFVIRMHTPYYETLAIDKAGQEVTLGDRFTCWMEDTMIKRSDYITSATVSHANFIVQNFHIDKKKIKILPLGIKISPTEKRLSIPECTDKLKVLYVSRLEKRKGTITLIKAIPQIISEVPDVEFIFIGKDRPHAPGEKYFKDYFLENFKRYENKARFLGYLKDEDLPRYYLECDIFVVPSVYESFGLVYLEAMGRGKPVIACKVGGVPEVVKDGETGILVEPNNVNELAKAIILLLKNATLRKNMGMKAKEWMRERFTSERMSKDTEILYKEILHL